LCGIKKGVLLHSQSRAEGRGEREKAWGLKSFLKIFQNKVAGLKIICIFAAPNEKNRLGN
jgi:hypothetical protein